MFVRMVLLIVVTCILMTLVLGNGWLVWLPAATAFAVVGYVKRVLDR